MNTFSYLSGMTSLVLALGVTRLFVGIGTLLEHRKSIRIYWVHLIWTLNVFLYIVLSWWILFRWQDHQGWNFFLFIFLLLSPSVNFLLAVMLFPTALKETDFKQYFYRNHRWFFALAAALPVIDVFDTLLKGYAHFQAQGPLYVAVIALTLILSVSGAVTKSENYHKFFAVFFLIYILVFISINLNVLA